MSKQFYTSTEAASLIGLAPNTVNRRCSQGKIEASRDGFGTWVISADVVESERLRVASKSSKMGPDCYRKPHEPADGYFTAEQAAKMVGVTSRTLARRAGDRLIPGARRIGRVWEFSQESIDHEIARLAGSPQPAAKTVPAAPKRKAPAMTVKVKVSEFTASLGVASDAELAANRARLAQVARTAKKYTFIGANGETDVKKRDLK